MSADLLPLFTIAFDARAELLPRLPRTGDIAAWENWQLEVVDLDGKRVDKVLASSRPETLESAHNAGASQIGTGKARGSTE